MQSVLGIDAGGTHTRCYLADSKGQVLAFGHAGPANINFVSSEDARSAIENALSESLVSGQQRVDAAVITGAHLPPHILEMISQDSGAKDIRYIDEFEACLAAGMTSSMSSPLSGIVVLAGTGSFCKGRNKQGKEKYIGGWGPLIGDEGSGYEIAREALRAVVMAGDGRGPKTAMTDDILTQLGITAIDELKSKLYNPPAKRHEIAVLARHVFVAAEAGDAVAKQILKDAGLRLAQLASPVLQALFAADEAFPVVLAGGVFTAESALSAALRSEISRMRPNAKTFISPFPPVIGAVLIGLQSIGVNIDSTVIENLKKGVPGKDSLYTPEMRMEK